METYRFRKEAGVHQETKNGHPRSITLCDPAIQELHRLHEVHNPQKPLVFASKTAFGRIDIKKAWQQALKRAGYEYKQAIVTAMTR